MITLGAPASLQASRYIVLFHGHPVRFSDAETKRIAHTCEEARATRFTTREEAHLTALDHSFTSHSIKSIQSTNP